MDSTHVWLSVRQAALRAQCQSSLHQLGVAVHNFADVNGTMPPYYGVYPCTGPSTAVGNVPANRRKMFGSWFAHLLSYYPGMQIAH
jgi:hypothetical protein